MAISVSVYIYNAQIKGTQHDAEAGYTSWSIHSIAMRSKGTFVICTCTWSICGSLMTLKILHCVLSLSNVIFTAHKRSLGQGNIFRSVCQEFCSGGGACSGGCLVLEGCLLGGVPAPGRCLLWGFACLGGCLVLGGACSGGTFSGGVPAPGGACSQGVPGGDPPSGTATAAGGTHPTGMHSCSVWIHKAVF